MKEVHLVPEMKQVLEDQRLESPIVHNVMTFAEQDNLSETDMYAALAYYLLMENTMQREKLIEQLNTTVAPLIVMR